MNSLRLCIIDELSMMMSAPGDSLMCTFPACGFFRRLNAAEDFTQRPRSTQRPQRPQRSDTGSARSARRGDRESRERSAWCTKIRGRTTDQFTTACGVTSSEPDEYFLISDILIPAHPVSPRSESGRRILRRDQQDEQECGEDADKLGPS